MRSLSCLAIGLAILICWATAAAAGSAAGQVGAYQIQASIVLLYMKAAESPAVPCNTSNLFAANITTTLGQAMLTLINTAERGGLMVTAMGAGTCTVVPGDEDLVGIQISGTPFQY